MHRRYASLAFSRIDDNISEGCFLGQAVANGRHVPAASSEGDHIVCCCCCHLLLLLKSSCKKVAQRFAIFWQLQRVFSDVDRFQLDRVEARRRIFRKHRLFESDTSSWKML
jgi:hypothetical protein